MRYMVSNVSELREVVLEVGTSGALFPVPVGVVNDNGEVVRELSVQFPNIVNPVNGRAALFMPGMEEVALGAIG